MLDYVVPYCNETLYRVLFWFFLYSILGWLVESLYMSFCNKKLTNRGFIHGPICPIYGLGGVSVHIILEDFAGNYILLYIVGALLATTLEFMTAKLMIKIFGCVWWDYSNKPYNYKGILCLESTIAWGFYAILDSMIIYNLIFKIINIVPENIGKIVVVAITIYFLIDLSYSLLHAKKGDVEAEENNMLAFK